VSFIAPLKRQAAVTVSKYNMIAKVENVNTKNDVAIYFNGNLVNPSEYSFSTATKTVTYSSSLLVGSNVYIVSGENISGAHQATAQIERKKKGVVEITGNQGVEPDPCDLPKIRMTSPNSNFTILDEHLFNFSGYLENITGYGQIEVYLNGVRMDGYAFNSVTSLFTHLVKFVDGESNYLIRLTNNCGTVEQEFKFNKKSAKTCGVNIELASNKSEFCLTKANGTLTTKDIVFNPKFNYSGQASSLYFKSTSNGKAKVNGVNYNLINGMYYHFTGKITVEISKNRIGSKGQWSLCVESIKPPLFGKGRTKPTNPCLNIENTKPEVKPRPDIKDKPEVKDKPVSRKKPAAREKPSNNKRGSKEGLEEKETPPKTEEIKTRNIRKPGGSN